MDASFETNTGTGLVPKRLLGGIVAVNLFVIGLAGFTLWQARLEQSAEAYSRAENLALALEQYLVGAFRTVDLTLADIADSYHLGGDPPSPQSSLQQVLAKRQARLEEAENLVVTDRAGAVVAAAVAAAPPCRAAATSPDAPAGAGLQISLPQRGPADGHWKIELSRPLTDDSGHFLGVACAIVSLHSITRTLAGLDVGPHGSINLRDDGLAFLLRLPATTRELTGTTLAPEELRSLVRRGLPAATYRGRSAVDGVERWYAYRRISPYPVHVSVGLAGSDVFAAWNRLALVVALVVTLFGTISGFSGTRLYAACRRQAADTNRLSRERQKFKSLFETTHDGVFFLDEQGFIECNERGAAMYGLSPEQVVGLRPTLLSPDLQPDGRRSEEVAAGLMARAMAGDGQFFEWRSQRADGTDFDTEITLRRIVLEGKPCLQAHVRDITERHRADLDLRNSQEALRTLIEALPDAIQFKDHEGRWLAFNRHAQAAFGLIGVDCAGKSDLELAQRVTSPFRESLRRCRETDEIAWQAGTLSRVEEIVGHDDGSAQIFDVTKVPLYRPDGSRKGLVIVTRDVTEARLAEARLRLAASVFEHSHEGICITDRNEQIMDVNPAFCELTGFRRDAIIGQTPRVLKSGLQDASFYGAMWKTIGEQGHWQGELWNRRPNGTLYAQRLTISAVCDAHGAPTHYVGVQSDITAARRHREELERSAHYDTLTGIPNRALLAIRIEQAIARSRQSGTLLATCYLDLDGFKPVNDRYGHGTGDRLLVIIADRLLHCLREGDTVARLGGDEFVLLFGGLEHPEEYRTTLERVLQSIAKPVSLDGHTLSISASIGVTLFPQDEAEPDTLLRHADQAMYRAKQEGRNRFQLFAAGAGTER